MSHMMRASRLSNVDRHELKGPGLKRYMAVFFSSLVFVSSCRKVVPMKTHVKRSLRIVVDPITSAGVQGLTLSRLGGSPIVSSCLSAPLFCFERCFRWATVKYTQRGLVLP